MNLWIPFAFFIVLSPGSKYRINAFEIIDLIPIFSRSFGLISLTANFVATGIKKGVSILPCLVFRTPNRALFEIEIILNILHQIRNKPWAYIEGFKTYYFLTLF